MVTNTLKGSKHTYLNMIVWRKFICLSASDFNIIDLNYNQPVTPIDKTYQIIPYLELPPNSFLDYDEELDYFQ